MFYLYLFVDDAVTQLAGAFQVLLGADGPSHQGNTLVLAGQTQFVVDGADLEGNEIRLDQRIEQQILIVVGHLGIVLAVIAQLAPDVLGRVAPQPDEHLGFKGLQDEMPRILCQLFHQQRLQTAHVGRAVVFDLNEQGHLTVYQRQHLIHRGDLLLGAQQPQLFQIPEGPLCYLSGNAGHALQLQIVEDDQLTVGSDADVQFDGVATLHRLLKSGKGIFGHALLLVVQAPVGHQFVLVDEFGSLPLGHKNPSTVG